MIYDWWLQTSWERPWLLALLPLLLLAFGLLRRSGLPALSLPTLQRMPGPGQHRLPWPFAGAAWLGLLAALCAVVALAGPRRGQAAETFTGKGIDIVLCFDISGSMLAADFAPNRLEAAKEVARQFIRSRPGDRLGITIFSSQSFTLCPLTTDRTTLLQQVDAIESGYLRDDGTAIGSGLATSVDRLRSNESPSKVVILLTDGVDFGGQIPPDKARDMAKLYGVKVYTVGMGSNEEVDEVVTTAAGPVVRKRRSEFNEGLLQNIATATGGRYFHAKNQETLGRIYASIDQLEKSDIRVQRFSRFTQGWLPWALAAAVLAAFAFVLRYGFGRTAL